MSTQVKCTCHFSWISYCKRFKPLLLQTTFCKSDHFSFLIGLEQIVYVFCSFSSHIIFCIAYTHHVSGLILRIEVRRQSYLIDVKSRKFHWSNLRIVNLLPRVLICGQELDVCKFRCLNDATTLNMILHYPTLPPFIFVTVYYNIMIFEQCYQ